MRFAVQLPNIEERANFTSDVDLFIAFENCLRQSVSPNETLAQGGSHPLWWVRNINRALGLPLWKKQAIDDMDLRKREREVLYQKRTSSLTHLSLATLLWEVGTNPLDARRNISIFELALRDMRKRSVRLVSCPTLHLRCTGKHGAAAPTLGELATGYVRGWEVRLIVRTEKLTPHIWRDAKDLEAQLPLVSNVALKASTPESCATYLRDVATSMAEAGKVNEATTLLEKLALMNIVVFAQEESQRAARRARNVARAATTPQAPWTDTPPARKVRI